MALNYCHSEGICHRDLKPENILIDSEGYLRITDFGLSKITPKKKQNMETPGNPDLTPIRRTETFCGTLEYMAPEMMQNKQYSTSVDWFSFGILLFEMLSGINIFKNEKQERIDPDEVPQRIEQILESEENLVKQYEDKGIFSDEAFDLLTKLLRFDPDQRIGCRDPGVIEIKQHPFFAGIDWDLLSRKAMVAPWRPQLKNRSTDVSNFDEEFTKMSFGDSPTTKDHRFSEYFADEVQFSNFTYGEMAGAEALHQEHENEAERHFDEVGRNNSIQTPKQGEQPTMEFEEKVPPIMEFEKLDSEVVGTVTIAKGETI